MKICVACVIIHKYFANYPSAHLRAGYDYTGTVRKAAKNINLSIKWLWTNRKTTIGERIFMWFSKSKGEIYHEYAYVKY